MCLLGSPDLDRVRERGGDSGHGGRQIDGVRESMCVCVCVCVKERGSESESEKKRVEIC